ncbi:MAG: flavin reductase [Ardenticatenaceae bacterium]|nr:MAG: flavin reductase [Ardenticatenaceae bacterium]
MNKVQLTPNTTLYPVPVVLVTCGAGEKVNVFTLNRIASCNAEPPMVSISVRPSRASHDLVDQSGEFVVNIPWPGLELVSDFVGTTSGREVDKWHETGLTTQPAAVVKPPLLDACPVNLECQVRHTLRLPSHSLFVAEVVALHALPDVLNGRQEVDFHRTGAGLVYRASVVRERPVEKIRPNELRRQVHRWRERD